VLPLLLVLLLMAVLMLLLLPLRRSGKERAVKSR
jgi:hypothetical protein